MRATGGGAQRRGTLVPACVALGHELVDDHVEHGTGREREAEREQDRRPAMLTAAKAIRR